MQLYSVHKLMIASGIALCVVFAAREGLLLSRGDGTVAMLGVAVALGIGLAVYLRVFVRKVAARDE